MQRRFVLDACALLAFLNNEPGADKVEELLKRARKKEITLYVHAINLLEIYYGLYREEGEKAAEEFLDLTRELPLKVKRRISSRFVREAGRLKANYKLSLADAIAVAGANLYHGKIVTADHHELGVLSESGLADILWIR